MNEESDSRIKYSILFMRFSSVYSYVGNIDRTGYQ